MPKGTPVTVTLPPYILGQLEKLEEKTQLKKSALVTIAIEKYAREFEKNEREEENRGKSEK